MMVRGVEKTISDEEFYEIVARNAPTAVINLAPVFGYSKTQTLQRCRQLRALGLVKLYTRAHGKRKKNCFFVDLPK